MYQGLLKMISSVGAIVASFVSGLVISAIMFAAFLKIKFLRDNLLVSTFAIGLNFVLTIAFAISFFWYDFDFIANIKPSFFWITCLATTVLLLLSLLNNYLINAFGLLFAIALIVWGGDCYVVFYDAWPEFVNELMTVVVWFLFSSGFYVVSGLYPIPQMVALVVCCGFVFMTVFGVVPAMLTFVLAAFAGSLVLSCIQAKDQPIYSKIAPFLGFLTGWVGVISYNEFLLPSFVILTAFYLVELVISFLRKITLLPRYKNMEYNSVLMQSYVSGIPAEKLLRMFVSMNVILVFLSGFQIYSENTYSVPLFAILVVVWQLYRIINWQTENKTLRETNKEIVREVKKFFSKDKTDDD